MTARSEFNAWRAHTAEAALFYSAHGGEAMNARDRRHYAGLVFEIGAIATAMDVAYQLERES